MLIPKLLIYFIGVILFLNSGSNDILVACATSIGSRSLHRRVIILCILLSGFLTYSVLRSNFSDGLRANLWYSLIEETLRNDEHRQDILGASILAAVFFPIISFISKYPLPLDAAFCSFFLGYIFTSSADAPVVFSHFRSLVVTYLVMPMISGCFTWLMYRILIKGIMFADEEEKFKVTLSWCGFIYPTALSALVTAFAFINYLYSAPISSKIIIGLLTLTISYTLSYALFKIFLRAWLKRRAFLMYPQEYAVYLERSEKVEQGDREARGLGPIQDYYLPKTTSTNSTGLPKGHNQLHSSVKDSNSTVLQPTTPVISPAVIAGKLAIISKRSEELFRPITNIMSVSLLFLVSSFESFNLMTIIKAASGHTSTKIPTFVLWLSLVAFLFGGIFFSYRSGTLIGRGIIHDMRFSQAFAIQLGTLLTLTVAFFLHSIPPAPMWYLFASVAAVSIGLSKEQITATVEDPNDEDVPVEITFRYKLGLIIFFWCSAIIFGFFIGAAVCKLYKNIK